MASNFINDLGKQIWMREVKNARLHGATVVLRNLERSVFTLKSNLTIAWSIRQGLNLIILVQTSPSVNKLLII